MNRKIFIPLTDEILYERPELITSPLRPFQIGHPCFRWLSAEIEAVDPETVDIIPGDPEVEFALPQVAMHFSPIISSSRLTREGYRYHSELRKQYALPCKDAA